MYRRFTMSRLSVKIDRNEFTDVNKGKQEIWGYQLSIDGEIMKAETIKGRVKLDDTRLMRYVRCYKWALEKIAGYINTNENITANIDETNETSETDETDLTIFITNHIVYTWLNTGKPCREYRIPYDDMLGVLDEIPVTVKFLKADRKWGYRKKLTPSSVTTHRERYTNLASYLSTLEGDE